MTVIITNGQRTYQFPGCHFFSCFVEWQRGFQVPPLPPPPPCWNPYDRKSTHTVGMLGDAMTSRAWLHYHVFGQPGQVLVFLLLRAQLHKEGVDEGVLDVAHYADGGVHLSQLLNHQVGHHEGGLGAPVLSRHLYPHQLKNMPVKQSWWDTSSSIVRNTTRMEMRFHKGVLCLFVLFTNNNTTIQPSVKPMSTNVHC